MNILRELEIARQGKNQKTYMAKTKLPTKNRTENLRCGQCHKQGATRQKISQKETRILCPKCIAQNRRRDDREKPHFVKFFLTDDKIGAKRIG